MLTPGAKIDVAFCAHVWYNRGVNNPIMPVAASDSLDKEALRTHLRARLALGDTASVKEVGKDAYAVVARVRNELRPAQDALDAVCEVLAEHLSANGREAINDPDFAIMLAPAKPLPPLTNEAALYDALYALRIDGEPLPDEVLGPAAYIEAPPPPPPCKRTNLTKIKPLVRKFGAPVQALLDQYVTRRDAPRKLIFAPKEQHVDHGKSALT